jgi:ABC-type glutathione transport system ATPase component
VKTAERVAGVADGRRARAGERLLACEGLFHLYLLEGREVVALQGVDFGVDWCEMVALLGPSGSGKSTMLAILGGLERPSAGRVVLDGIDVARLTEAQLTMLRRRRLGFVWQGAARNLLPHASAWENLDLPMTLAGLPAGRRRRRARMLLDAVDLGDAAAKPIRALSGGSSSAWPSRSPWPTTRPCCWPTSRPASSTGPTSAAWSSCSRRPATTSAPRWSWSPTTPRWRRPWTGP